MENSAALDASGRNDALLLYAPMLESMADGALIANRSGEVVAVNEAAARVFGVARDHLLLPLRDYGERFDLRAPGDASPTSLAPRALHGGFDAPVGRVIRTPDGVEKHVRTSAAPLRDERGAVVGALVLISDTTERTRVEEALRRSEADARARAAAVEDTLLETEKRFRVLADSAPVIMWMTNAEGDVVFVNRTFREFFGATLEEVAGGRWHPLVHRDDGGYVESFARAVRERKPFRAEGRVRRFDGAWRWVESHGDPLFSRNGEFLGHVGLSPDITDRKHAEAALRESEARYRMLFDSIDEGFCVVEVLFDDADKPTDYRFVEVNQAFERQTGLVNAAGRRMRELAPSHEEHWFEIYGRVARTGEPIRFENRAEALGRWYDVYAFRVGEPERRKVAILFNDITDRKRAYDALRDADRRKNEFLGMLSHELRNPLAPIRNSVYLLERAAPDGDQASRARGVIRRQTEHLTRLVDDLLDVTRISRGKVDLQRSRVDLREIVHKTTEDLLSLFEQSEVALRVEHAAGPVWVDADATRIAQVVGNLLHNAVKFTPARGTVFIGIAPRDGRAEIRVRDTGDGMEPQHVESMFEPFAQADRTLARTKGGLGLGLALVKGIVELHGGSVRAGSDGLGRGSEFIVTLPLSTAGAAASERRSVPAGPSGRLVLIIEDNVDAGETLAEMLELEGHRVRVAHNGRSGLELARELRPDVVLCDIGLPDLDGYEVARALRREDALRSTRLIAVSGYAQPEDRERASEAGFDAHIAKPPAPDELLKAVAHDP
jgi:PAS domain S-box-containing protein